MRSISVKNLSTKEINRTLGKLITDTRKKNSLSEAQLAKAIGVTTQQIQKYERGDNVIVISRLLLMCELMNVPSVDLMKQLQKRLQLING